MKRKLEIGIVAAIALAASAAAAQTVGDLIVGQLQSQGYQQIQLSRTWLGRTRIVARKGNQVREIIFNPSTGEILRDFWKPVLRPSEGSGNSGEILDPDDEDDEEEDDDDDDDDEEEEDNSGPGGGGGGSGNSGKG